MTAKQLCTTHYNNKYYPDRHATVQVPCAWCGTLVSKNKSNNSKRRPTCSDPCRKALQFPPKSNLPEDHWALWYGKASAWPRLPLSACDHCGETYAQASRNSMYCSARCREKVAWINRVHASGGLTREEWAQVDRNCTDCAATYRSPHAGDIRCVPCRTVARAKSRSWITPARRLRLYVRDNYMCHLCGEVTDPTLDATDANYPTLDHLIPRSKGGTDDDTNLSTAHFECNWIRSDDDLESIGSLTLLA